MPKLNNDIKKCEKKCKEEYKQNNKIAKEEYEAKLLVNKQILNVCLEACKKKRRKFGKK